MKSPTWKTWITSPTRGGNRTTSPALYFRREFSLAKMPDGKVHLHLAVLGLADVEINGQRVSDETLVPGWQDYRFRTFYRTYEVSHLLRKGANAIGVTLGNGWYCGHVGDFKRQVYGEHPLFALSLADEKKVLLQADKTWRYNDHGPIIENDIYQGESYDARLALGAWTQPKYNDKTWQPALAAETPKIAVQPAFSPSVRPQETFKGREIHDFSSPNKVGAVVKIFDFGQNIAGRVRLRVKGPRGVNLTIRHAEMLEANGTLHTANLRSACATDNYTLAGTGDWEEWEPRFTFHGFRYCEVVWLGTDAATKKMKVSLEAVALYSDLPKTGTLECSDPLLNQLISNVRWGQKGNFLDVPTDCPQRDERLGWTGDAQAFIRTAAFFLDVDSFFRAWLYSVRDSQSIYGGAVPPYSPYIASWWGLQPEGGPGWGDVVFIAPWTAYLCYGDKAILRENYDAMLAYLKHLEKNACVGDVRSHADCKTFRGYGDWLAVDRQGNFVPTSVELLGTAFHAYGAEITARTAEVLGKDAAPLWALHAKLVEAYRKNFLDKKGLPIEQTQTAHVIPLHFGLTPEKARQAVGDRLAELVKENDYHMNTGFLGTPYLLSTLEAAGHLDVCYRLLTQQAFPSWLFPVKNGATTIWERWDSWTPERGFHPDGMNSFNHYAYGVVAEWMVTTMAGLDLDPAEPAYRHIVFKPRPGGGITNARASLQTRYGHTAIAWKLQGKTLRVTLDVPEGAYATLSLPPEYQNTAPERIEPGHHEFNNLMVMV